MGGEGDSGYQLNFPDAPKLELDELIDQLVSRAESVRRAQGRLRNLLRATQSVSGDLSLERILRRIIESARELVGSRYAALGVIGNDHHLEQFIYVGIDDQSATKIGHLPEGKGLLGALISDPRPIRLDRMSDDPRSAGFPADHPPMESFLGVPIRIRDEVYGNLYLTDSVNGRFSAEDEELLSALASAAGTAINNARLYREAQQEHRWSEASAEVQAQLLSSTGEDPLRTIARRAIDVSGSDLVTVSLVDPTDEAVMVEAAFGQGAEDLLGRRFPLNETIASQVIESGEPLLLDNPLAGGPLPIANLALIMDAGPLIVVPLRDEERTRGALTLIRRRGRTGFTDADVRMASGFAAHASVALQLADAREFAEQMVMLEERDRIARDLHDHVIQELFSVGLGLESIAGHLEGSPDVARRIIGKVDEIDRAIRRIRTSIFTLQGGLISTPGEALRNRILQIAGEVTPLLGFAPAVSFTGLVDSVVDASLLDDVIACVRESLTNVRRHAHASSVSIDVQLKGTKLTIRVADDGIGMPKDPERRSGVANLATRAEKRGGSLRITSRDGGGTLLEWTASVNGRS
ncbi:GAF domain-containing protein [Microlunatus sp. Gsoil 973]|uniref:sensor histidine kinase n=1 Tax=Microlunatus sp. Gsoil 973 TaxID=2672569 RepID=UPI0012B4F087|nr:GAF domain-containing protein [Microlunatus sp. Gsoil 973]QGN34298.1 GAF domain-containing protein [Microlunatus sp. Gsoil 973]